MPTQGGERNRTQPGAIADGPALGSIYTGTVARGGLRGVIGKRSVGRRSIERAPDCPKIAGAVRIVKRPALLDPVPVSLHQHAQIALVTQVRAGRIAAENEIHLGPADVAQSAISEHFGNGKHAAAEPGDRADLLALRMRPFGVAVG